MRRIDTFGTITTIAGNGDNVYNGDNIPATDAAIYAPHCVAIDGAGNMYITDFENHRVRKVNTAGIITTIAGTGISGYDGDNGPATSAKINGPYGIALDTEGNIYFADDWENVVRKINGSGIITTFAGSETATTLGDGGPATAASLNHPVGIAIDGLNNVFVTVASQERKRKVNGSIITTIAGVGMLGLSGDNGLATGAQLSFPCGITLDPSEGTIFFADFGNNRVRRIGWPEEVNDPIDRLSNIKVYPNPSTGNCTCIVSSGINELFDVSIVDIFGRVVKEFAVESGSPNQLGLTCPGIYRLIARSKTKNMSTPVIITN